jgi:nitroreductase
VSDALAVLELARWAPSGDNSQPWRFSVDGQDRITVYGHDTRAHCVYDLDGRPSQISLGALIESIAIAATRFGRSAQVRRRASPDEAPVFDISLAEAPGLAEDPLVSCIEKRRVARRALSTRALRSEERLALEQAVAPRFSLRWFEGIRGRARIAALNFENAKLRLTLREAYPTHRDVIEWNATTSEDRIPDAALGASRASLSMMRWAMASWSRIDTLNRYFAGTLAPRVEMDLVPGLRCAAHCAIVAAEPPTVVDDYVAAGRALQRFWLTATRLGLQFQPGYTPLVFARYVREGVRFTEHPPSLDRARTIRERLQRLFGRDVEPRIVFIGRIGEGPPAAARSVRLPLERLLHGGDS